MEGGANLRDDAVEGRLLVAKAGLHGTKLAEVLGCLGHDVLAQLHDDASRGLAANGHVEEDLGREQGSKVVT